MRCRSRRGNRVRAGGFLRVDRLDTSKEVCFVQINTGESRSDSLDMLCVLRVGYQVNLRGQIWSYCHKTVVHGLSAVFIIKDHVTLIIRNGPNIIQFLLVDNPCNKLPKVFAAFCVMFCPVVSLCFSEKPGYFISQPLVFVPQFFRPGLLCSLSICSWF